MENNPVPDQTFYSGMTEKILNLSLEIIYLLTGEDYTVVRKTYDKFVTPMSFPHVSGVRSRNESPIMEPPPLVPERNKKQKILEITYKMIELLSGEVPIRCQDVNIFFSKEEWDYIEGHKDIIMKNHQNLTSPDGSSERNPSERCPSPWYSQDGPEEDYSVPEGEQAEDVADIKVEVLEEEKEGDLIDDLQCKEEASPVEISPGCTDFAKLVCRSKVTETLRQQVVQMKAKGATISAIAKAVGRSKSVISRILHLYNITNSFKSPKKAGRPRKTNAREDRIMQRISMSNHLNTAAGIARQFSTEHGKDLSRHTVSRRLKGFSSDNKVAPILCNLLIGGGLGERTPTDHENEGPSAP